MPLRMREKGAASAHRREIHDRRWVLDGELGGAGGGEDEAQELPP